MHTHIHTYREKKGKKKERRQKDKTLGVITGMRHQKILRGRGSMAAPPTSVNTRLFHMTHRYA